MASEPGGHVPVVCAGIVVADVFVPPLPTLPGPGELIATDDFVVETGGCAANAAMALARLGVRPAVVARVGATSSVTSSRTSSAPREST